MCRALCASVMGCSTSPEGRDFGHRVSSLCCGACWSDTSGFWEKMPGTLTHSMCAFTVRRHSGPSVAARARQAGGRSVTETQGLTVGCVSNIGSQAGVRVPAGGMCRVFRGT